MAEEAARKVTIKIPRISPWSVTTAVCAVILIMMYIGVIPTSISGRFTAIGGLSGEISAGEAANKAIDYINNNLVQGGGVSFVGVEEMRGVYKVATTYQGNEIDVYVTKDGVWLFVSPPFDMITPLTTTTTQPQEEVDWSVFQTSLPDELKNEILAFEYEEPVQIEDKVVEFKNYPECKGNVIVFYLEWCGWCEQYHPVLSEAKEDYTSLNFYTLDLGENGDIGDKFGVSGTPATVINCKYFVSGYLSKEALYPILDKYTA